MLEVLKGVLCPQEVASGLALSLQQTQCRKSQNLMTAKLTLALCSSTLGSSTFWPPGWSAEGYLCLPVFSKGSLVPSCTCPGLP